MFLILIVPLIQVAKTIPANHLTQLTSFTIGLIERKAIVIPITHLIKDMSIFILDLGFLSTGCDLTSPSIVSILDYELSFLNS